MPVPDDGDNLSWLRATLETALIGITVTGSEETVEFANPAFASLHWQDDASALFGREWPAVFDHGIVARITSDGWLGDDCETQVAVEAAPAATRRSGSSFLAHGTPTMLGRKARPTTPSNGTNRPKEQP